MNRRDRSINDVIYLSQSNGFLGFDRITVDGLGVRDFSDTEIIGRIRALIPEIEAEEECSDLYHFIISAGTQNIQTSALNYRKASALRNLVEAVYMPFNSFLSKLEKHKNRDEQFPHLQSILLKCLELTEERRLLLEGKAKKRGDDEGYVYLLRSEMGQYKIGKAKKASKRYSALKTQLPFAVEMIYSIKVSQKSKLETKLHQTFSAQRLNGEWFSLSPEDVDVVKTISENWNG